MRNIDACLYVRPSDRTTLERLVADGKTAQKIVARARIVLLSGRGFGTNSIQREARVSKPTVWRWQKAYMDGGVERLLKDRGKGARAGKKPISAEVQLAIVKRTAQEKPKHATHWSARMLAEEIGVGHTTVQRVWKEHGLKPHLTRPFKLSTSKILKVSHFSTQYHKSLLTKTNSTHHQPHKTSQTYTLQPIPHFHSLTIYITQIS